MDLMIKYFRLTGMYKNLPTVPHYGIVQITFNGVDVTHSASCGLPDDVWA
jgi:hypothetical protein